MYTDLCFVGNCHMQKLSEIDGANCMIAQFNYGNIVHNYTIICKKLVKNSVVSL